MAYSVKAHRLEHNDQPVDFQRSPNGGASMTPRFLIIHYTAGTSAQGAISWLKNPAAQASAHLVIDRNGTVTQMMEFNKVAWHAGKSSWGDITGLNRHSIGIELVNAGKLNKTGNGAWVNWAGNKVDDNEVYILTHKHENAPAGWQCFTQAQYDAVSEIGLLLHQKYDLLDILGHDDISPGRKIDPGPAFPMISLQSRIIGRND